MERVDAHTVRCESVVAMERVDARDEVREYAEELYVDQLETWYALKKANKPCKSRPPTREECFKKSREIRLKRERKQAESRRNDFSAPS